MSETLVIKILPSTPGGKLDVEDALQQVLDTIALLKSASKSPDHVGWHLERATTNSPLEVTAEPYGRVADIDVVAEARDAKRAFASGVRSLVRGRAPEWMDRSARKSARRLMVRNTRGIGKTAVLTNSDASPVEITAKSAAVAIETLNKIDLAAEPEIPAHVARGSIEGRLDSVGIHYGHPALWLKSRVYGRIPCVVPDQELERIGGETTLVEVWTNKRIIVTGRLHYGSGGELERVYADHLEKIDRAPVGVERILDKEFTSGLEPSEYLRRLQDGDLG